jgi:IS5 family transposase
VVGQAKSFSQEIALGVKKSSDVFQQAALEDLRKELDRMTPRVKQVMQQGRARIFGGDTHVPEKLVSIFEPSTEVIRKGKASKPTEFGKMVKIQEAENQIITCYSVYEKRPYDSALLIPAIESHEEQLGRVPRLVAGDAAFYSASNEKAAHDKGVKRVCIPNRNTGALNGSGNKRNPGSATGRNGEPAVKGASAW